MKVPGDSLVSSKITTVETKPARIAPGSPVQRRQDAAPAGSGPSPADGADLHLTGAARNLASIEQALRAMPAVDELRVAAVRQRLQDGSYEIEPQRVADRLLRMEADLAHAAPFGRSPLK